MDTFLVHINHINGNKSDNTLCNLERVTITYNNNHALNTGLNKLGEGRVNAKLTQKSVEYIRNHKEEHTFKELAIIFGVSKSSVYHAFKGKTFR